MRQWVLLGLLLAGVLGWSQQSANIDFFADSGGCELDFDKDGRVDRLAHYFEGDVASAFTFRLDNTIKFSGNASQHLSLSRSSGTEGRVVLFEAIDFSALLKPSIGEPILVSVALRAEGFQNAEYQVRVNTGSRSVVVQPFTSQDTPGWRTHSAVVPVERNAEGQPFFRLLVEVRVGAGAASGRLWIDEMRAVSTRSVIRNRTFPNGLKLMLNFLYPNREGFAYLGELPFSFVLGVETNAQILRRHFSEVKHAPYTYFSGTLVSSFYRHNADLYNYDDVNMNHPDWFLLDRNGQRIPLDDSWYIDIGRPEVRERAWQSLRDFMLRNGRPSLIYLDNVDMLIGPSRFGPPNYPSNELWVQAVINWFEYVGSRLKNEFGTTFIPNVAWAPGFWLRGLPGYPDAPGVATLPYVGGFLIEHFGMLARSDGTYFLPVYGTATGSTGPGNWDRRVLRDSIRLVTENPNRVSLLIPTLWVGREDTPRMVRYAIALCLIVQHENTYIHLDPRRQQELYPSGFFPPELFIPLGNPVGNYRIQGGDIIVGGLFIRDYQNGIVLCNPTHDRSFTYTVPRDLYDWDRNLIRAGTQLTIAPRTGVVLWSAPEITIALSPNQVEVLPGGTAQFTVTYRNTGTAPGTNVRIAVPLPDGMTLIGSDPMATVENGQVVWVVPNIPVNGTGTLRFTVRVQ